MATITIPGMFLTGDHASRPAANTVGGGSIYSCTTHSLLYQSDGSSWSTWATLGGGAVAAEDVSITDAGTYFTGTDVEAALQELGAAGGGSTPASARYIRTAGDYTTNSTTYVDVDGTNLALTISTGANRVMVGFAGSGFNSTSGAKIGLTVAVDGTDQGAGQPFGFVYQRVSAANEYHNLSFVYVTDTLTAASHTFKLRWAVNTGTATLAGGTGGGPQSEFWVAEIA